MPSPRFHALDTGCGPAQLPQSPLSLPTFVAPAAVAVYPTRPVILGVRPLSAVLLKASL